MSDLIHANKLLSFFVEAVKQKQEVKLVHYGLEFKPMPYNIESPAPRLLVIDGDGREFILQITPVEPIPRNFDDAHKREINPTEEVDINGT